MSFLLQPWNFSPGLILLAMMMGYLYTRGWQTLRRATTPSLTTPHAVLVSPWHLLSYYAALLILLIALLSPIDALGASLFAFHMVQHLLLVMVVPPLIWLANPFPVILWGLPGRGRKTVGGWFRTDTPLRRTLRALTPPGWVWMAFIGVYLGWHDPNAYDAALRFDWVHSIEHLTFFFTALLFWWHVTGAAPHIHPTLKPGVRIAFTASMIPINMGAGAVIAFSSTVIYPYYASVPRLWGLSVMQDQMLAGTIMWLPGSMMVLVAVLILVARLLSEDQKKSPPKPLRPPEEVQLQV